MPRTRLRVWQVPVTEALDDLVEEAVASDTHVTKSDLIRDSVRQRLAAMGFVYMNPGSKSSATTKQSGGH